MAITSRELNEYLTKLLLPVPMMDYGPNGLQIEGKQEIKKIAFAVSATKYSIQKAVEMQADAMIVHHGIFWNFHGPRTITGPYYHRVAPFIKNDINLFAFHLPLDGNPELGHAVEILKALDCTNDGPFGEYKKTVTGAHGTFRHPITAKELQCKIEKICNHPVIIASHNAEATVKNIGIITGGASGAWFDAYQMGLDAFLTGEISEHDWHDAIEHEVHMFAAGHNATEEFGIKALMNKITKDFSVECQFIPSVNPA